MPGAGHDAYHLTDSMNDIVNKARETGMPHPTEESERRTEGLGYHLLVTEENSQR